MSEQLPDRVDALRLAESEQELAGQLPISSLSRLTPHLASDEGGVEVHLRFGVDEAGHRYVAGRFRAEVRLVCQRCLEPVALVIEAETALGIVEEEAEAESLPERYEPLVVSRQPVVLKDIVEDELILALPIVPMHPAETCPAMETLAEGEGREQDEEKVTPFSVLANLKKRD